MTKRTNPTSTSLLKKYLLELEPGTQLRKRDVYNYLLGVAPWIAKNTPNFTVLQALNAGALREIDKRTVVVASKRAVKKWDVHSVLPEEHVIGKNSKRVPGKKVNTKPKQLEMNLSLATTRAVIAAHKPREYTFTQPRPSVDMTNVVFNILDEKTCRYASIEQLQDAALLIMIELAYRARSK